MAKKPKQPEPQPLPDSVPGAAPWKSLVEVLPRLKTPMQLVGFVVLVGAVVSYKAVPQDFVPGVIATGSVGLYLVAFGLILHLVNRVSAFQTPGFVIALLGILSVFFLLLFFLAVYYLRSEREREAKLSAAKAEYKALLHQRHDHNLVLIDRVWGALGGAYGRLGGSLANLRSAKADLEQRMRSIERAVDSDSLVASSEARGYYNELVDKINNQLVKDINEFEEQCRTELALLGLLVEQTTNYSIESYMKKEKR